MGMSRRLVLIGFCALLAAFAGMAFDPHGFRLYRQLGREVRNLDARNAELARNIDRTQHRVEALRAGPQALERAAHENGYVHADETLFELR
jgi:cell division protein FtsB